MKAVRLVLVVFATILIASSALMAQTVVKAELSGENEVPPIPTNASGEAIFVVYPDRIEFTLRASGFGTEVQASHIHLGFPGVNGPVVLFLFNKATQGTFPGIVSGTLFAADLVQQKDRGLTSFDDVRRALLNGRTYTNIHTTLASGGEIRGQNKIVRSE